MNFKYLIYSIDSHLAYCFENSPLSHFPRGSMSAIYAYIQMSSNFDYGANVIKI